MIENKFVSVIIAAAGMSNRMGSKINKAFLLINDKPILAHTIEKFERSKYIDEIIIVCKEDEIDYTRKEIVNRYKFTKVVNIVKGGKERQDSVYNGIKAISVNADIVLTHDGARPFIRTETINKAVETVLNCDACVVGVRVKDTIKSVNEDDTVHHTPKRSLLWQAQSPQCFKKDVLLRGYEHAIKENILATDDSALVEFAGVEVKMLEGHYDNIKITTPEDLVIAEIFNTNWKKKLKSTGAF